MYDAQNYDFDAWTKLKIQGLVKERMEGKYKDDGPQRYLTFEEYRASKRKCRAPADLGEDHHYYKMALA